MKQVALSKAPVYKRFLADFIDGFLISIVSLVILLLIESAPFKQSLTLIIFLLYDVGFTFKNQGATIGKKILNIKVVSLKDTIVLPQIVIMSLTSSIVALVLLYALHIFTKGAWYASLLEIILFILVMMLDPKNRSVSDLVAGTWVVKTK